MNGKEIYTTPTHTYDVIVIGGGHAGIEAAHAAAKLGSHTLLATLSIEKIGTMPCNPAIGGVGKGHIVYDISALGGLMPKLCTQTYLQVRMLNTRKGPAVQGLRLQIDKHAYSALSQKMLVQLNNLTIHEGMVEDILTDSNQQVTGVRMQDGTIFTAPTVIITGGTFLNGKIHIGQKSMAAGRQGEQAVSGLSLFLQRMNLEMGRLKTGTPPRIRTSSLDFSRMEKQEADSLDYLFEFAPHNARSSHDCYITHTNEHTHQIIKDNLHQSGMYNGTIQSRGPRYCPSIEDKVSRFPDKQSHHVFVEPEDRTYEEVYPNGISTALPLEVQEQYVRSIVGFENAIIAKPGYAVEYDFVLPNQLHETLEVKSVPGLFLAGQINGTTGYEEAAGQGLVAGINAHQKAQSKDPFILDRSQSYIGVMINDLVTMSVDEPYRMFTSRAERRLLLRQDNAFMRLTQKGYDLGLVDEQMYQDFAHERALIEQTLSALRTGKQQCDVMRLYGLDVAAVQTFARENSIPLSTRAALNVHAEIRYEPYLERERTEVKRREQYKTLKLPATLRYTNMPGLSRELQEKLDRIRPATIAEASLIPGMTPAAISLLIFKVRSTQI